MSLFDQSVKFWESVNISTNSESSKPAGQYIPLLSECYANVIYKVFNFEYTQESLEFSKNQLFSYLVKQKLFEKPELQLAFESYNLYTDFSKHFQEIHPYELPGALAIILQEGGAYSSRNIDMKNYELGLNFSLEMTNGDLNSAIILSSNSSWSTFFYDVAWDHTIVVYVPSKNFMSIILATDTD
jgi:hypothetical protein